MRTTSILIIGIIVVVFALFYRLYKFKLGELNKKVEGYQSKNKCRPKNTNFSREGIIERKMRVFINKSVPIVKHGTVKISPNNIPLLLEELKYTLIHFFKDFCNIDIKLRSNLPNIVDKIPIYTIDINEQGKRYRNYPPENENFTNQISNFCNDMNECDYFILDFNINIGKKLISLLEVLSFNNIDFDPSTLELIEQVSLNKKYNEAQKNMLIVFHLSRTFYLSRNYSEKQKLSLCNTNNEHFTDYYLSNIVENLKLELVSDDFDNSTLLEEYYSSRGLNLLIYKRKIKDKINENCAFGIKPYIFDYKDIIDKVSKIDRNADVLKSMINMTGSYTSDKMKSVDKVVNKWNDFHTNYKDQLEDLLVKSFSIHDPDHKIKRNTHNFRINKLKRELQRLKEKKNPNNTEYDKFFRNEQVSLQNQNDGTILNYSRVIENGKYVDKYLIFVNGGCLKNIGGKLVIEYDYHFHKNNSNLHFTIEVINNNKDYIAKMNYTTVDSDRDEKFRMDEIPTILISPVNMYSKVLVLENEKLYLDNCSGRKEERFRFREVIENSCNFSNKKV